MSAGGTPCPWSIRTATTRDRPPPGTCCAPRGPPRQQVSDYGRLLRALGERSWSHPDRVLGALLHMHHNRLVGIDRESERLAHAVARGAAQAHTDRRRHGR